MNRHNSAERVRSLVLAALIIGSAVGMTVTVVGPATAAANSASFDVAEDTTRSDDTITVTGDTGTTVLADELLYLVIYEVLDNALTHGRPPATVTVDQRPDSVTVAVSDTGPGVAVSPRESLFEPNTRGADSDGDGLGLYLADLILERYDGEIRLAGGANTTFEIEVPTVDSRFATPQIEA